MPINTTLHSKSCCHFLMIYVKKSITEYLHGQNLHIKFLLFALLLRLCTQVTWKMHSFSAYQTCAIFFLYIITNWKKTLFNPSTPMGDQDRVSPYNINTIPGRQMMRIKKNIN